MGYILGIDIGTGSVKAVAVNGASGPTLVGQHHYPVHAARPGYSEQDPELIWKAFINCLRGAVVKLNEGPSAIGLSSAMHSLIPVDSEGNPLANMITWADTRSTGIAARLKDTDGNSLYKATGMPLHAMSPLCKIIWIRENDPGLFEQTHKFISIKEYIWYKLFREFCADYSIAGATGMFDVAGLNWNSRALELAGIAPDQLSALVNTDYTRSGADPAIVSVTGIDPDTPFVIGASDGCLASLGSSATGVGVAALTIGTSGAVRIASPAPVFNTEALTFSYYLDKDTFICGGPVNNGGNVLQWLLKDFMGKETLSESDYTALFTRVDAVKPGSEGLIFLPYLAGERAPIWDAKSCGTFFGIKMYHTQAFFARAALEGVCYALNDILLAMEKYSAEIREIHVSGGFVLSATWMQILADITGKKLVLMQTEDASAMGAAYMAMKAVGPVNGKYPPPVDTKQILIEPDQLNHKIYARNFIIYKQLYTDLRATMHQAYSPNS